MGRSSRPLRNIVGIFGLERIASPSRCRLRDRIKIIQVRKSRHNLIVISSNDKWSKGFYPLGHFVRIRTVVDDIPKAQNAFPAAFSRRESGVEGREIRVNIAQY